MDSWFILVLLGSSLTRVGANNATTGKLSFDKAGVLNRILLSHLMTKIGDLGGIKERKN